MKVYFKAIIFGLLADLGASIIGGYLIFFLLSAQEKPEPLFPSLFLGVVAALIGGYVTATFSSSQRIFNAFLFGIAEVVVSFVLFLVTPVPFWFFLTSLAVMVPAALVGAYSKIIQIESKEAKQETEASPYLDLLRGVNRILVTEWNPLDIKNDSLADYRYSSYAFELFSMLRYRISEEELERYLLGVEKGKMDLQPNADRAKRVAAKLLALRNSLVT